MINPAELNKLKDALYRDSSKEIAEAIIALAKNAENIIELMALCGFFTSIIVQSWLLTFGSL